MKASPYYSGLALSVATQLVSMAAGLITVVVAARILSPTELGGYFIVLAISQISSVLGGLGLRTAAIQYLSRPSIDTATFFSVSRVFWSWTLIVSICASLILSLLLPKIRQWSGADISIATLYLAVPMTFFLIAVDTASSLLVSGCRFKELAATNVAAEVMRSVMAVSALVLGGGVLGMLGAMIASRAMLLIAVRKVSPGQFGLQLYSEHPLSLVRASGWLYGCSVLAIVASRSADAMVVAYLGSAAYAVYTVALQLPTIAQRLFDAMRPTVIAYISSKEQEPLAKTGAGIRIVSSVMAIAACFLIATADWVVRILYSDQYAAAGDVLRALGVWTAFGVTNYLLTVVLIGWGQARKAFFMLIPQLVFVLIFMPSLVRELDAVGAAVGLLSASFIANIVGAWLISDGHFNHFVKLVVAFLRSALPVLGCLAASIMYPQGLFRGLLVAGSFVIVLWLTGAIQLSDRALLARSGRV